MTRSRQIGITLMELLTVMVIVGILAAIAIPSYRTYLMRAQRSDATAALLRVAAAQEKFYLQNNVYATQAQIGNAPPAGLGVPVSGGVALTERGYYQLVLNSANTALDFTVTATPIAGGPQVKDTSCATFTINQQGTRGATNGSSGDTTASCWR